MLIKTGDAEILNVVDPEEIKKEEGRSSILASALDRAKELVSSNKPTQEKTEN